jgi:hypothetical protein
VSDKVSQVFPVRGKERLLLPAIKFPNIYFRSKSACGEISTLHLQKLLEAKSAATTISEKVEEALRGYRFFLSLSVHLC